MARAYAKIGLLNNKSSSDDFVFDFSLNRDATTRLAPHHQRRSYSNVYVPVPLALSHHAPDEWKANNPIEFGIEFEIVGDGQRNVTADLNKLRKFMRKDKRTGEPPDLVFETGSVFWKVRIHRMDVTPVLWNEKGEEQRVKVSLTMRTTELLK